jgi:hypothetical protein
MPGGCALSLDSTPAVPKALLTSGITWLARAELAELCAALNIAAGC